MPHATLPLVLVSGISGCLGASVAHAFLRAGYPVRGTVRKQAQADAWTRHFPAHFDEGKLEVVLVDDMAREGAFDEAMRGVGIVVHTASPFFFGYEDNERDMLLPAVHGTLSALRAAHTAGTVKHVILTSSFAALQDYHAGLAPGKVYSEEDWCPLEWDEAKTTKDQLMVYVASKKYAEKRAWEFVETEKPGFALTTILPTYIIGRSEQPLDSVDGLSVSAAWIREFIDKEELPVAPIQSMIDVTDCARAHLLAAQKPTISAGRRYLVAAHTFTGSDGAHALREAFPEQAGRFPDPRGERGWEKKESWTVDASRVQQELGIEWKPFEQTMREAAEQVFEFEKRAVEKA
ncbi:methylglyoxal reductase (NADPH-dependent) gre2 [Rhodotorula kratochvilovae]